MPSSIPMIPMRSVRQIEKLFELHGAALHNQVGAEIAERHRGEIREGAAQDVERRHQRHRERDAGHQQRGALPAERQLARDVAPVNGHAIAPARL